MTLAELFARILGPSRRLGGPERFCPTLADVELERVMKTTIVQAIPLPIEPEVIHVDLAALRRIRLELAETIIGFVVLAASEIGRAHV